MSDTTSTFRRVTVEWTSEALRPPERISRGRIVPNRFEATVDDDGVPFVAALDVSVEGGRPAVESIHLTRRPMDPPIDARAIRKLPLRSFLEDAITHAQLPVTEKEPGHFVVRPVNVEDDDDLAAARRVAQVASRRRRRVVDPAEHAAEVKRAGDVYAEALADEAQRRRPLLYVAETLFVSRAKASRLVKEHREGRER
jgi:hypothetical protein